jgi:N,N-dimethylformamidase
MTELLGYADRRSVRPGDRVTLMISSDAGEVRADLVRFVDGSPDPESAPARWVPASPPMAVEGPAALQSAGHGSHADLPLPGGWDTQGRACLRLWFLSTTPPADPSKIADEASQSRMTGRSLPTEDRRQVIAAIGRGDGSAQLAVVIAADGRLTLELDGTPVCATTGIVIGRAWYGLLVAVDGASVSLQVSSHVGSWFTADHEERIDASREGWRLRDSDLLRLATWRTDTAEECFNGKIASPALSVHGAIDDPLPLLREDRPLPGALVGAWDPSLEPGSGRLMDRGPGGHHGHTVNLPTRAATGPFWRPGDGGRLTGQHDAVHFHADDVGDLGWRPTLSLDLPETLEGGVYAIRLTAQEQVMHVPLWVRPSRPRARVAYLASTNTYLAYANHRMFLGNSDLNHYIASHPVVPNDRDVLVLDRPYLGRSVYDLHDDGSGVCMASWARPLISFEPEARDFLAAGPRNYAADLYIVGWLERTGLGYDVVTDEDLDVDGQEALRPYEVVITGSHPEYWTRRMMDGLQAYLRSGGKLMYLGGNGFYWMTSLSADRSTIEVRRGQQGTRAWDSEPGEAVHASTGELGGLWRNLGLCPQSIVGVGMAAQGWGGGRGYRRLPDSFDPRVADFFEGIPADELIGNFGFVMCGAVGDEVDRMDRALGTPPQALHLATSQTLPDEYQLVVEEVRNMTPAFGGTLCDAVRSDMVWFDLPGGGEVFSVGSVSWAAALGWQDGDNNVDRLSSNVLRAFLGRREQATAADRAA